MDTFLKTVVELPLLKPLLALLKSRKFMVAVVTLVVNMLVAQFPELEAVQTELITVITLVGSVLIASIALEDYAVKRTPKDLAQG